MSDKKTELNEDELEEVTGGKGLISWLFGKGNGLMINKTNNNSNVFTCETCGLQFKSNHELKSHINKIHSTMM